VIDIPEVEVLSAGHEIELIAVVPVVVVGGEVQEKIDENEQGEDGPGRARESPGLKTGPNGARTLKRPGFVSTL
jgi:hypothetical protein